LQKRTSRRLRRLAEASTLAYVIGIPADINGLVPWTGIPTLAGLRHWCSLRVLRFWMLRF
jgi:hypothetical protein